MQRFILVLPQTQIVTVVSRFGGLTRNRDSTKVVGTNNKTNRDSPLNKTIPMVWFDHSCCQPATKIVHYIETIY